MPNIENETTDNPAYVVRRSATGSVARSRHRFADVARAQRIARLDRMWRRFVADVLAEGLATTEELEAVTRFEDRRRWMFKWVRRGLPSAFRFHSALEACDIGLEHHFRPSAPEPTDAPAGSAEKLRILQERLERGVELCHPADNRLAWAGAGE